MMNETVVSPDLMLDWLEKKRNIFGELDRQLIRGLKNAGSGLTLDHLQAVVEHRNPFGDFFRETGEFTIKIPALKRPTLEELQEKYNWIKSIERDISPEGPLTLTLGTVLLPSENRIDGKEYKRRLVFVPSAPLGLQHRDYMLDHQDNPELAPFNAYLGEFYVDFPGIIVVHGDGDPALPYVDDGGKRCDGGWRWADSGLNDYGRIALGKQQQ